MTAAISASSVNGTIMVPASKSAMQRACALALLNNGITVIQNPGKSNDELAAVNIINRLGAITEYVNNELVVKSSGQITYNGYLDCNESGLSVRMFSAIAALGNKEIILNGSGSLLKRPLYFFDEVFPLLNIKIKTNNGFLPVNIKGPLMPSNITIDGSVSSQYLTGLLFAYAKAAKKAVIISVDNLKSKPYIDLSLQLLKHFDYHVNNDGYHKFYIEPSLQKEREIKYYTEADWSSASFLLVAAAVSGNIVLKGLDIFSVQADRIILDVLQDAGANVTVEGNCILINDQKELIPFRFDATDCPDLFPPLVVLAAFCKGITVIKGVSRLADKESNRSLALKEVFTNLGIEIIIRDDEMFIHGGTGIRSAKVSSHHDHRIAMACAVAGLRSTGIVTINDAEVINKSYPDFFNHLQLLGAAVSLTDQ